MSSHHLIDRRTYLKGIGVALALPLLESMGWAEPDKKKALAEQSVIASGFASDGQQP